MPPTRGTILSLTEDEVTTRWLSHLTMTYNGLPLRYCLKDYNGGSNPKAPYCHSVDPEGRASADCIGFVLHGSGIDRKQPGYKGLLGEWLNCKSLGHDARTAQRFCRRLEKGEAPHEGDWLLNDAHIAGVLRPATEVGPMLTIDCSPFHGRETAIGLRTKPWAANCVVVRPTFYAD